MEATAELLAAALLLACRELIKGCSSSGDLCDGGETVEKYFGGAFRLLPSCLLTLGVMIADNGGGIADPPAPDGLIISEKILSMS